MKLFARERANAPKLVVAGGLDETDYVAGLQPLLTERTVLAGKFARSAMAPLYRGAKVYINASLHEGSSNAVLEAIAAGCPILLSDIPENRDFGLPAKNYFRSRFAGRDRRGAEARASTIRARSLSIRANI